MTPRSGWFTVAVNMAKKSKKKKRRGPVQVYWENPPGPESRVKVCRWVGDQEFFRWVDADGYLTPAEAASAMDISRVYVYRLVREGRLEAVSTDPTRISLRSIKEFNEERER